MKLRYVAWIFLASFLGSYAAATPVAENAYQIVAVVGKVAITSLQFEQRLLHIKNQLMTQKTKIPAEAVLRDIVLEQLINEEVIVQHAQNRGVKISDQEVQATLQNIAKQRNVTMDVVEKELIKQYGNKESAYQALQRLIIMNSFQSQVISQRIQVTDQDVEEAMKTKDAQYFNDHYLLEQILFVLPNITDQEKIEILENQIKKAVQALQAGQDLAVATQSLKEQAVVIHVEKLNWMPAYALMSPLSEAVPQLAVGGYTDLMRSPNGLMVFELVGKKQDSADKTEVKQYHVAHILLKIQDKTNDKDCLKKIQQLKDRLLKGEDFSEIAKEYSDDTSRQEGGDIGWIDLGQTVAPFEAAFTQLALNTVSEPVRTEFGWHLIKVIGIRTYNAHYQDFKKVMQQKLIQQNAEAVLTDHVSQLREATYVEKRPIN